MSCFQGSDQVTCIIQDGNVVWSAAVPRCEGKHEYRQFTFLLSLLQSAVCPHVFHLISFTLTSIILNGIGRSSPEIQGDAFITCRIPYSEMQICSRCHNRRVVNSYFSTFCRGECILLLCGSSILTVLTKSQLQMLAVVNKWNGGDDLIEQSCHLITSYEI